MDSQLREITQDVFLFEDTCNVYVIKHRDSAILIDFGRGDVLHHLPSIGVGRVDWILHTHHHREQCQGDAIANRLGIPIAVPKQEAGLFKDVEHYWNNLFQKEGHVLGAPFVRPLRASIAVARELSEGDVIPLGALSITALETPGNSQGSISFQLNENHQSIIFSGDLFMDDGRLINLYDSEWDYGYCGGLKATVQSCEKLAVLSPDLLLPSHGNPIASAGQACHAMAARLTELTERDYLRDWTNSTDEIFESSVETTPSIIDEVDVVSPHLLRWKGTFGSLYIILNDEGSALMVDAGIILYQDRNREQFFRTRLDQLMRHYGLHTIEAMMLTHYHGDHLDIYPCLQRDYGTKLWCFENMVEVIEYPERFNLMALLPSYGTDYRLTVDRIVHDGESVDWGNYRFTFFHLPGQTYYAMGISCTIDGVDTVFTGDNIFYSESGSGHDAFAMRNKAILEEGYLKCAETLRRLKPDRLLGGHTVLIGAPQPQIERYYQWALRFRESLTQFSPCESYEWLIDPYWAEIYPFQLWVQAGNTSPQLSVKLRNHNRNRTVMSGVLCGPDGWGFEPASFTVEIDPKCERQIDFSVHLPASQAAGRYPVTIDLTLDGSQLGELFEAVVDIRA